MAESIEIIKENIPTVFDGCDAVVRYPDTHTAPIRLLQLTDMQIIDAAQQRTPNRLRPDETAAWLPENFDAQFGNHVRALVSMCQPDLIFITGDMVYGEFDDGGTTMQWFVSFMDSFGIPWAPVFGNHDNESKMGVSWQCEQLSKGRYSLFKKGNVTGNGNYTVGIAVGDTLVRVLHMLDSNGCGGGNAEEVQRHAGIYGDQLALLERHSEKIAAAQGKTVPAFAAFHIPTKEFDAAERGNGYRTDERALYTVGVDVPARNGDFGCRLEHCGMIQTDDRFSAILHGYGFDGLFVGHCHNICTSILYDGIRYTYGLKTGQYDYHIPGLVGGTLITLTAHPQTGEAFTVVHVPSTVARAPYPSEATMLKNAVTKE